MNAGEEARKQSRLQNRGFQALNFDSAFLLQVSQCPSGVAQRAASMAALTSAAFFSLVALDGPLDLLP